MEETVTHETRHTGVLWHRLAKRGHVEASSKTSYTAWLVLSQVLRHPRPRCTCAFTKTIEPTASCYRTCALLQRPQRMCNPRLHPSQTLCVTAASDARKTSALKHVCWQCDATCICLQSRRAQCCRDCRRPILGSVPTFQQPKTLPAQASSIEQP